MLHVVDLCISFISLLFIQCARAAGGPGTLVSVIARAHSHDDLSKAFVDTAVSPVI